MSTTRLHISGLTPAISENDLRQRFSTFGEVKGVDGIGKLDGVGRPRKFAYLTLETTQPKLSRCMNLLNGSTWKGAKLRIGTAKPDYLARHEREVNPPPPAPRPKLDPLARRRARLKFRLRARRLLRGTQGKHAKDMLPVTLETVSKHKGWRRTPLDHLIRSMRMRPLRPLPPTLSKLRAQPKTKTKIKKKERKKWELTRARCTVIDPARYGAVHLTSEGGLLGAELLVGQDDVQVKDAPVVEEEAEEDESSQESEVEEEASSTPPAPVTTPKPPTTKQPTPPTQQSAQPSQPLSIATRPTNSDDPAASLAEEKASALALLGGMFGDGEWDGRESVSGDEAQDGQREMELDDEADLGYEVVSGEKEEVASEPQEGEDMEEDEQVESEEEVDGDESSESEEEVEVDPAQQNYNSLKDMFKPQEDSGGFSLGLDIELDEDAESYLPASIQPEPQPESVLQPTAPTTSTTQTRTIRFTPDPKAMFFFPGVGKKDVFNVISERGWEWPHPGTSDEIRAKWDKGKAELTREYTRRYREAVKKKRRGGVGGVLHTTNLGPSAEMVATIAKSPAACSHRLVDHPLAPTREPKRRTSTVALLKLSLDTRTVGTIMLPLDLPVSASANGGGNLRHRIKEIRINPSPSEYRIKLELCVDDKEYHSFKSIKPGCQLRWDFKSLPYDVHANSRIKLRVIERYRLSDKSRSVWYLVQDAEDKPSISLELEPSNSSSAGENPPSRIIIEFPGTQDIPVGFFAARMRVNATRGTSSTFEIVRNGRQSFNSIREIVNVILHYPITGLDDRTIKSVKLALAVGDVVWQCVERYLKQGHENVVRLVGGLNSLLPAIELAEEYAHEGSLTTTVSKLGNLIEDVSFFVMIYLSNDDGAAHILRGSMKETQSERLNNLMRKFTEFKDEFDIGVREEFIKRAATNEQWMLLSKLDPVPHSHYRFTKPCQEGTRTRFLQQMHDWTHNQEERLLWVHGHVGLGKSTISASICERLDKDGVLGAHFFCNRDDPELQSPGRLLNTLVYRLARHYKPYGRAVTAVIGNNTELPGSALEERFTELIDKPLRKLEAEKRGPDQTLFLVVDALDECEQRDGRRLVSKFLLLISRLPWIKVIVTSRPDLEIKLSFSNPNSSRVTARDLFDEDASADIHTFIRKEMADIAGRESLTQWPGDDIRKLSSCAGGLFIWAATACKSIGNGSSPATRFRSVIEDAQNGFESLDELYTAAIKLSMNDGAGHNVDNVRLCLGAIVATSSRTPLPISSLAALLHRRIADGLIRSVVRRLGSVIHEDASAGGAVRAFHPSFLEYLRDKSRCNEFYMERQDQNMILADCCLNTMIQELKFNMCGLEMSHSLNSNASGLEVQVKTNIRAHLEYSCLHWASHITLTRWGELQHILDEFLWGKSLVFWIEALSLLSKLGAAVLNLKQLMAWTPSSEKYHLSCADDAYRFVLYFYDVISISAPHLYISALAYVPKKFEIARRMRPLFSDTFTSAAGTEINQPNNLRDIKLAQGTKLLAFSPCGDRIVSCLTRGRVQMLDAKSGAVESEMGAPPLGNIETVVFSADGRRMASISDGFTIHAWDLLSGTVPRALGGPFTRLPTVAFSSDGHQIVAVSHDCMIFTFDAENGDISSTLLVGCPPVNDFFLSPLGRCVAGSTNDEVKVWSTHTGNEVTVVAHGLGPFEGVAMSPDGRHIATRSLRLLSIWETNTGSLLHQIPQPEAWEYSMAFSPDNHHLLEGFSNNLQLWNIESGVQIWYARVDTASVERIMGEMEFKAHVAFSSDGRRAMSCLDAKTVQVWDMERKVPLCEPAGLQLELSLPLVPSPPNARRLVPTPYDPTIQVWDAETAKRGSGSDQDTMTRVVFSPDGHRFAFISDDGTTRIWDTRVDTDFPELLIDVEASSIAFSPNDDRVVLGSGRLVQIWEIGTTAEPLQLEGHELPITTVAFSPGARLVASGSHDNSVRIWSAGTGNQVLAPLLADTTVHRVVFSQNGRRVVSMYEGGTIRVWDTLTGAMVQLLNFTTFHDGELYPLACADFSIDSQYVAFGIFRAIRSYDMEGTTGLPTILGYFGSVHSVSLSSDGRYVASNAEDNKMWIRNVDIASDVPRIMTMFASSATGLQSIMGDS